MRFLSKDTKFASLGKPGEIFSNGFKRRLGMISAIINLKDKTILDLGCGKGVWLKEFAKFTNPKLIYGTEFDSEMVAFLINDRNSPANLAFIPHKNIIQSAGELLPFEDDFFDVVFLNEVLEHVSDDVQTMKECLRICKKGGKVVFFTPNRRWPFETHGIFIGQNYIWGNIPLVPYLPKVVYKIFAPHVRNYLNIDILNIIKNASTEDYKGKIIFHKHVFPGFDNLKNKFGRTGTLFANVIHQLEKTPLHHFGISHFVIVEKL